MSVFQVCFVLMKAKEDGCFNESERGRDQSAWKTYGELFKHLSRGQRNGMSNVQAEIWLDGGRLF